MRRIDLTPTEHVSLRLPTHIVDEYRKMADSENPWRAIMRDALKQYLRRLGKLKD